MSKYEIEMELTGFKMKVKGDRADATIAKQIGESFAGLLQPIGLLEDTPLMKDLNAPPAPSLDAPAKAPKKRSSGTRAAKTADTPPIEWKHDPAKYASPRQSWPTADKAMYILFVAKAEKGLAELTNAEIVATFNKHFKEAKVIRASNVSRDLALKKSSKESLVAEDTTKNPSTWYLTESGIKYVEKLIAETKAA